MSKFNNEIYKVKAIVMNDVDEKDGDVVCGFYSWEVCDFVHVPNINFAEKLEYPSEPYVVNTYSICRNTGIKLKDGSYLYEFDLVEYVDQRSDKNIGMIEFSDFYGHFFIRSNANHTSYKELKPSHINKVIGNVILSNADAKTFQEYSDKMDANYTPNTEPECRSTQHINKLNKRFLPK